METRREKGMFKRGMFQHGMSGLLLVLFIVLALGSATTEGAVKANDYYEQGKKQADRKDWDNAFVSFSMAIELDQNFTDAYFQRGIVNINLSRLTEAVADYNKVIELNPQSFGAYNNRGIAYKVLGISEAYTNAFGYETDAVSSSKNVSELTEALKYFNLALSDFNKASESTNPNTQQRATKEIAEAQKRKGEVEKALAASTAQQKAKEEINRYDPSKFTVIPSNFKPSDYTRVDLFKAVADARNLQTSTSKEEAMLNQFQSGFVLGGRNYFLEYVSDLTFVRQNGTDITFSADDNAITQNMTIDQRSGLQAGQKVRVYYEVTRSPLTTWDVIAIERR